MKIINTEKVVIKSWCNNPEGGVVELADGGTVGIRELSSWEILEIADVVL